MGGRLTGTDALRVCHTAKAAPLSSCMFHVWPLVRAGQEKGLFIRTTSVPPPTALPQPARSTAASPPEPQEGSSGTIS